MKPFIIYFILVAGTLASISAKAQTELPVFSVLASRGDVTATKANGTDTHDKLSAGKKLFKNETVEVGGKGYIGLMHRSGKTLEVKEAGSFPVSMLEARLGDSKATSSQRYAKYVFGEMTKDEEKDMKKNHQQFMSVTGAVERSTSLRKPIKTMIPRSVVIANGNYNLSWHSVPGVTKYNLTVIDLYNDVVAVIPTNDTTCTFNLSKITKLQKEKMCMVQVSVPGKETLKSNQQAFNIMPADVAQKINKEATNITSDGSAVGQLSVAMFFENNDLYLDAMHAYLNAIKLEPETEDYKIAYTDFLMRIGLSETAKN